MYSGIKYLFQQDRLPQAANYIKLSGGRIRDLWIKAYSRLPIAYRSVSRPSSPLTAKASTKRPFALDLDPEEVAFSIKSITFPLFHLVRLKNIFA